MQLRFKVAGMSDMGLVRTNNEDNFQIARDLSVEPMRWINNEACLLTEAGALLVVADGMGGMNAGEVASQIAIDTVRELFSPERLKTVPLSDGHAVNAYLASAVSEADRRIKVTAASHPETHGMGTTIVIAWLLGGWLYVAWCGDSRAYVYNAACGLRRLTKDHSYVQSLVDIGKLTDEQAFDFPQNNIITRCLSDSRNQAEPDTLPTPYQVADGDIILLCTDGLCGMLRDSQTEEILRRQSPDDLTATAKALIEGALGAGGSDNVTVALLQVISGGVRPNCRPLPLESALAAEAASLTGGGKGRKIWIPGAIIGAFVGVVVAGAAFIFMGDKDKDAGKATAADIDLINGRDSLYVNSGYPAATSRGVASSAAGTVSQSQQLITDASAGLVGAMEAGKSSASAGQTPPEPVNPAYTRHSESDSVAGHPHEKTQEPTQPARKVKQDTTPQTVTPPPAKKPAPKDPLDPARKTTKIKLEGSVAEVLANHRMTMEQLEKLNPKINFHGYVPINTVLTVYEK